MGVFLDKPKKEKESEAGEGNGLRYALCSMQGWRVEMEDAHAIKIAAGEPPIDKLSFFAVFDGHAGDFVSKYSSENLLDTILSVEDLENTDSKATDSTFDKECSYENKTFEAQVIRGFLELDRSMREHEKFQSGDERSGSTAVAAFISDKKVAFANCGDSRGLLCSGEEIFSTIDHKPYNAEEKARIERAGGSVMIQRVNGSLAVSRALGDYDYKNVSGLPPVEQLVSAEPELTFYERKDSDEFLVLACDGVWDVMTNEDVVAYIRNRLNVQQNLQTICEELLDTCLAKGSRDNMSVILIAFPHAPSINDLAVQKEKELEEEIRKRVGDIVNSSSGSPAILSTILEELGNANLIGLPPGGGIQAKAQLVEEILDELVPNRDKDENNSLPLNMMDMIGRKQEQFEEEEDEDPIN